MKNFWRIMTVLTLTAVILAGCGAAENAGENAASQASMENETAGTSAAEETTSAEEPEEAVEDAGDAGDAGEADEIPVAEEVEEEPENLEPDPTNLTYLEEYQIADFYGDGKEYPLYAPKDGMNTDGFFYFDDHGVTFTASVYSGASH